MAIHKVELPELFVRKLLHGLCKSAAGLVAHDHKIIVCGKIVCGGLLQGAELFFNPVVVRRFGLFAQMVAAQIVQGRADRGKGAGWFPPRGLLILLQQPLHILIQAIVHIPAGDMLVELHPEALLQAKVVHPDEEVLGRFPLDRLFVNEHSRRGDGLQLIRKAVFLQRRPRVFLGPLIYLGGRRHGVLVERRIADRHQMDVVQLRRVQIGIIGGDDLLCQTADRLQLRGKVLNVLCLLVKRFLALGIVVGAPHKDAVGAGSDEHQLEAILVEQFIGVRQLLNIGLLAGDYHTAGLSRLLHFGVGLVYPFLVNVRKGVHAVVALQLRGRFGRLLGHPGLDPALAAMLLVLIPGDRAACDRQQGGDLVVEVFALLRAVRFHQKGGDPEGLEALPGFSVLIELGDALFQLVPQPALLRVPFQYGPHRLIAQLGMLQALLHLLRVLVEPGLQIRRLLVRGRLYLAEVAQTLGKRVFIGPLLLNDDVQLFQGLFRREIAEKLLHLPRLPVFLHGGGDLQPLAGHHILHKTQKIVRCRHCSVLLILQRRRSG